MALAPFNLWPIGLVSLAVLAYLLKDRGPKATFWYSFLYGLGYYGIGVSWVFVSIYDFGGGSLPIALGMTAGFVLLLSTIFTQSFWLYSFSFRNRFWLLGFAIAWSLGEWLRTWLFTGFPWLNPGYAHLNTPLAGWAPIIGVMGIGFILALTASCISQIRRSIPTLLTAVVIASLWSGGALLRSYEWTRPIGTPISVATIQPNIDQNRKWDRNYRGPTFERLYGASAPLWENTDWIIWPEAAIPMLTSEAQYHFDELNHLANESNTAFFTGILSDYYTPEKRIIYNSIIGLGTANGVYYKQRLVPFGEYVPLEHALRGLIDFFDLPASAINLGPSGQDLITAGPYKVSTSICYEIAYSHLIAEHANNAHALITISNDAWFGDSIGPKQHAQMAQMRALETQRYLIRATNNGISLIADNKGQIVKKVESFVLTSLKADVQPMEGSTPYMRWQDKPLLALLVVLYLTFVIAHWRGKSSLEKSLT